MPNVLLKELTLLTRSALLTVVRSLERLRKPGAKTVAPPASPEMVPMSSPVQAGVAAAKFSVTLGVPVSTRVISKKPAVSVVSLAALAEVSAAPETTTPTAGTQPLGALLGEP